MPYGLACIAAVLRRQGFRVSILDGLATNKSRILALPGEMAYLEPYYGRADLSPFGLFHHYRHYGYSLAHMAQQAKQSGAFLVGISSLFSAYSDMALQTAAAVKQALPRSAVVLGGHHPTAMPAEVMQHPAVDYILRGDGEVGMPVLADALCTGKSLEQVPGLVRRLPDGTLKVLPPAVAAEMEALPPPAFDLIDQRFYARHRKISITLCATRGCPFRCSYCAVNADTYHGYRRRSVASVMAEIDTATREQPVGFIDFEDEHLSADKSWFKDLLLAIRQRFPVDPPELRAMNGLYAPSLDDAVVQLMKQAGFRALNLALITIDPAQLKRFNRRDIHNEVDAVLDLAQRYGLSAVAYIIIAGPGQEPVASLNDLLFLAQRRVLAGVSVFYPAPGSRDYQWCQQRNLLPAHNSLLRATALPLAHHTQRIQTVTLLRLGRILNYMKQMIDLGQPLPAPAACHRETFLSSERMEMGKVLLAGFLHDGIIRGVDEEGKVYTHQVDPDLAHGFLKGLEKIQLKGTVL